MSFMEDVEAETRMLKGCPIPSLDEEVRDVVDNHPEYAAAAIGRALANTGASHVTKAHVARHRRRECTCWSTQAGR